MGAVVAVSVAGVAFVTVTQASPAYRERLTGITTVFSSDSNESNIRSRQIETRAVWKNIRSHPIEGIGLTTPYLSNVQFQYQEPTYLHNNALWIWLKFGVLGLGALPPARLAGRAPSRSERHANSVRAARITDAEGEPGVVRDAAWLLRGDAHRVVPHRKHPTSGDRGRSHGHRGQRGRRLATRRGSRNAVGI